MQQQGKESRAKHAVSLLRNAVQQKKKALNSRVAVAKKTLSRKASRAAVPAARRAVSSTNKKTKAAALLDSRFCSITQVVQIGPTDLGNLAHID